MAVDVFLAVDYPADMPAPRPADPFEHYFSRRFYDFKCSCNAAGELTELEFISRLTAVGITPLREMDEYQPAEEIAARLAEAATEPERRQLRRQAERSINIAGNVGRVTGTIDALLTQLALVPDLPGELARQGFEVEAEDHWYFTDFLLDKGQGFHTSFGQDLRNFRRFLDWVPRHARTTVFFEYWC